MPELCRYPWYEPASAIRVKRRMREFPIKRLVAHLKLLPIELFVEINYLTMKLCAVYATRGDGCMPHLPDRDTLRSNCGVSLYPGSVRSLDDSEACVSEHM